jgi:hypothetical protein
MKRCFQATSLKDRLTVVPRRELIDLAVAVAIDDLGERVGER